MKGTSYPYEQENEYLYYFKSMGQKQIIKVVEFTPTEVDNIYSLGFSDLLEDGSTDDRSNSNNGDMTIILRTIIKIMIAFTTRFPTSSVCFFGSTMERTRLYNRIIQRYYPEFRDQFTITGLMQEGWEMIELPFHPECTDFFNGFLINKI